MEKDIDFFIKREKENAGEECKGRNGWAVRERIKIADMLLHEGRPRAHKARWQLPTSQGEVFPKKPNFDLKLLVSRTVRI